MVTNRRKKVVKYRGHTTHGGGHRKKRRGSGSRGGVGRAGSGKRAGHRKYGITLGSVGFLPRRNQNEIRAINVGYLTSVKLDKLSLAGLINKQGNCYVIELKKLGFDKLLSTGKIKDKVKLTVAYCTPKAEEKIRAAGGQVQILKENSSISAIKAAKQSSESLSEIEN